MSEKVNPETETNEAESESGFPMKLVGGILFAAVAAGGTALYLKWKKSLDEERALWVEEEEEKPSEKE